MAKTFKLHMLNYILSPGSYGIAVKAKADGYTDSEISNTVNYISGVAVRGVWHFNDKVNSTGLPGVIRENVKFRSNGVSYSYINFDTGEFHFGETHVGQTRGVDSTQSSWTDQAYRTIVFDGTQYVTKKFLKWFTANADHLGNALTDIWYFKPNPTLPAPDITQECYGSTKNDGRFTSISAGERGITLGGKVVYTSESGWPDSTHRTITFEDIQIVSTDFYNWFTSNATEVVEYLATPTVSVNGDTLVITPNNAMGVGIEIFVDGEKCDTFANLTGKYSVDLKEYDIEPGTHTITVKAVLDGYRDSELSTAASYVVYKEIFGEWIFDAPFVSEPITSQQVNFTSNGVAYQGIGVSSANTLSFYADFYNSDGYAVTSDTGTFYDSTKRTITFDGTQYVTKEFYDWMEAHAEGLTFMFTIAGTTYYADVGMTWREWVNSKYNTGGYSVYTYSGVHFIKQQSSNRYVAYKSTDGDVHADEVIAAYHYYHGK